MFPEEIMARQQATHPAKGGSLELKELLGSFGARPRKELTRLATVDPVCPGLGPGLLDRQLGLSSYKGEGDRNERGGGAQGRQG